MMTTYLLRRRVDRRDWRTRQALADRIEDAFITIPTICLTAAQAARFFGAGEDACGRILADLEEKGVERRNGFYAIWRREFVAAGFIDRSKSVLEIRPGPRPR